MRKKRDKGKNPPRERLVEALELPKDIALDMPKITVVGNREAAIENYKGIIEFDSQTVRLNTKMGMAKLEGSGLNISAITDEEIQMTGRITKIELLFEE